MPPAEDVIKVRFNDRMQQWLSWITQQATLLRPAEKRQAGYVTHYFERLQSALLHQAAGKRIKKKIISLVTAIQEQQYRNEQFADNFTEKLRLALHVKIAGQTADTGYRQHLPLQSGVRNQKSSVTRYSFMHEQSLPELLTFFHTVTQYIEEKTQGWMSFHYLTGSQVRAGAEVDLIIDNCAKQGSQANADETNHNDRENIDSHARQLMVQLGHRPDFSTLPHSKNTGSMISAPDTTPHLLQAERISPADIRVIINRQDRAPDSDSHDADNQLVNLIVNSVADEVQKSTLEQLNMNKAAQGLISPEYTGRHNGNPGRERRYRVYHSKAIARTSDHRLFYPQGPSLSCEQQQTLLQSLWQATCEIERHSALCFSPASPDQNADFTLDVFSDIHGYHIDFTSYFYKNRHEKRLSLSARILNDRVQLCNVFLREILFSLGMSDPPGGADFPYPGNMSGTESHPAKLMPVDRLALQKLHGRPGDIPGLASPLQASQPDSPPEQINEATHLLAESIASSLSQQACASPVHLPFFPGVAVHSIPFLEKIHPDKQGLSAHLT